MKKLMKIKQMNLTKDLETLIIQFKIQMLEKMKVRIQIILKTMSLKVKSKMDKMMIQRVITLN